MTHGTRIDINAIKSVLTRWITEGHITPLAAFNRFWGYTFHLMQEDEITNDEYNHVPWSRQSRMNTFIDDLLLVLERKENETGDPFISRPYEYIIHITLDPDAQKDTALISVQRKSTYEFVCKDISIPLKEL